MPSKKSLNELLKEALRSGATDARLIDASDIVIDERVRLKCEIPRCPNFGVHLLCPPNLMPVSEFRRAVRKYKKALIVQVESHHDSSDKSDDGLTLELCTEIEGKLHTAEPQKALHGLINKLEASAFKKGCYLALGLIAGECLLCPACVGARGSEPCRHPFEARPSMQAMGIDVVKTCKKAGLPVTLSSSNKVRWTGLVLLH